MQYFKNSSPSRWLWYYVLAHFCCTGILGSVFVPMPRNKFVKIVTKNGSDIFGWISPKGMIFQSTGQDIELFCTINLTTVGATNCTSSNLEFYKDGYPLISHARVNETTISLLLLNIHESNHSYTCFLNSNERKLSILALPDIHIKGDEKTDLSHPVQNQDYGIPSVSGDVEFQILIGSTHVIVEKKSEDVVDLHCYFNARTPNQISCIWKRPKDYASAKYTEYYLHLTSEYIDYRINYRCDSFEGNQEYCFWSKSLRTSNGNRNVGNLSVTVKNSFGTKKQTFPYDEFKHFKPEILTFSPERYHSTSIILVWSILLNYLGQHPLQMIFDICFRNYHKPIDTWNCNNYSEEIQGPKLTAEFEYSVTNLTPNTLYEFRGRCKSSDAPHFEEYWSDYAVQTSATSALFPEKDIDLFQIFHTTDDSLRMVHIFWILREYHHYFDNIEVFEVDETGRKKSTRPNFVRTVNYITVIPPSLMEESNTVPIGSSARCFVFVIRTHKGDDTSISINVPALNNEVKFCPFFYVVQHANNTYEYIWQPPKEKLDIVNYTLFWRNHISDEYLKPDEQNMNWMYLSIHQSTISFNFGPSMTNGSIYYENRWNFYIGGNTKNFHSSLQKSMELISSVSDFWKSERYLQLEKKELSMTTMEIKKEQNSKPRIKIGRKFSENQFHDWMIKLHGVEEPEACKGPKTVIRVEEHY